jgi:hypothetical protein
MKSPASIKDQIVEHCRREIQGRIDATRQSIDQLRRASLEETKSSAGDKYETGREMIQQEIDKLQGTLSVASNQLSILNRIEAGTADRMRLGSLVVTDQGNFFLSVSAPVFRSGSSEFLPVSVTSPIGQQIMKSRVGNTFTLNRRAFKVLEVY